MSKYRAHVGFPLETNAANENRSHHRGPPYDHLVVEDRQRERERFSQTLPVLRPRVCCYAASCFHAFQSSVFLFLLLPPLLLLFIFLYLRSFFWVGFRTRMSNAGFLSIFRDKWIEICKGYIPVLRGNKVTGER